MKMALSTLILSCVFLCGSTGFANAASPAATATAALTAAAPTERIQPLIQAEDMNVTPPSTAELGDASTINSAKVQEVIPQKNASEAAIPVKLADTKKSVQIESPWMRMVLTLTVLGIMSAFALYFIKRKKGIQKAIGPVPEVKLLTQFHLGPKKSLAIIRVAGESILIGVTDQNINLIKGLSLIDDEIPAQLPNRFQDAMEESADGDEFSIRGIQDVVAEKLRSMRSIQ